MKLLSVIKNAFAKMNEMLNKAWKWVGDFLVDTMTGEILETSCGLHSPAHKYTFSERVFFTTKATIFGSSTVTKNVKLKDSFWKSVYKASIKWTLLSLFWTFISFPFTNWILVSVGLSAISMATYVAIVLGIEYLTRLLVHSSPASYQEQYYEYVHSIKTAQVAA